MAILSGNARTALTVYTHFNLNGAQTLLISLVATMCIIQERLQIAENQCFSMIVKTALIALLALIFDQNSIAYLTNNLTRKLILRNLLKSYP